MNAVTLTRLNRSDPDFDARLEQLLAWEAVSNLAVNRTVDEILARVRVEGDAALVEYSNRFDRLQVSSMTELELDAERLQQALEGLGAEQRQALEVAAQRVRDYHQHQLQQSWQYTEADGTVLGQKVTPMDRVGIYVPGGKASYPSSVLMNAIPAKVAGVKEIIMVVPTPDAEVNDLVMVAAALAGVDKG